MRFRKYVTITLILTILCSLAGCGKNGNLNDEPGRGKWVDSDIYGSVKAEDEIRLVDDFAAAVNKDFIVSTQYDPNKDFQGPAEDAQDLVLSRYREVLADPAITGPNAEALRALEELTFDWDERNRLGVEPLRKYIDDIQSIASIDDMTDYQGSTERNPFGFGLIIPDVVTNQTLHIDKSTLVLSTPNYSLGDVESYKEMTPGVLESREKTDELTRYFLRRLGFEEKQIKDVLDGNYNVETFLARHECGDRYNSEEQFKKVQTTREELSPYVTYYPLFEILDSRGYGQADSFQVDYMYLTYLPLIYNDKHLEELKSFFIVQTLNKTQLLLDRESFERSIEIGLSRGEKSD